MLSLVHGLNDVDLIDIHGCGPFRTAQGLGFTASSQSGGVLHMVMTYSGYADLRSTR